MAIVELAGLMYVIGKDIMSNANRTPAPKNDSCFIAVSFMVSQAMDSIDQRLFDQNR